MGLLKWIKKELEFANFHKRRESAPAYMTGNFDPDLTRDEAYLKALNKFNAWRVSQRLERESKNITEDNLSPTKKLYDDELQNIRETDNEDFYAEPEKLKNSNTEIEQNVKIDVHNTDASLYENTTNVPERRKSRRLSEVERERRSSPPYQYVINKHGDTVDYALPYNEQNLNPSNRTTLTTSNSISSLIDPHKKSSILVTDLDKSLESRQYKPYICKELDSLEKWSDSIHNGTQNETFIHQPKANGIIVSDPNENWFRTKVLPCSALPLLEYSKGVFRNADVCFRTNKITNKGTAVLSKYALQKDMDVLNSIRHSNIILLMAISFDDYDEYNRMSLILESFDYTINHYFYEMNQTLSLNYIIQIIQQISSAVMYLHECGYVHSNISTHAILLTQTQTTVTAKLSNFELTTEVNCNNLQNEIRNTYSPLNVSKKMNSEEINKISELMLMIRNNQINVEQEYMKQSRKCNSIDYGCNENNLNKVDKKYLPYYIKHRKHFSQYFYQPPEILKSQYEFVFPTKSCDIYSLSLLLWEMINSCVPFAIFSESELESLYSSKSQSHKSNILPDFNPKYSIYFEKLLKYGLQVQPRKRIMNVKHLKILIDNAEKDILQIDELKNNDFFKDTNIDPLQAVKEDVQRLICQYPTDKMKRYVFPIKKQSEDNVNNNIDLNENINVFASQYEIRNETKTLKIKHEHENSSHLSSFDQFLSSKVEIYERTSTLKKKVKNETVQKPSRKSVKELFSSNCNKMENELNLIGDDIKYNKDDVIKEFQTKDGEMNDEDGYMNILENVNCNKDDNVYQFKTSCLSTNDDNDVDKNNSSYRFNIVDFSLPNTPIARKNKIRRNAWLSDYKMNNKSLINQKQNKRQQQLNEQKTHKEVNININITKNNNENRPITPKSNTNLVEDISKCLNDRFKDLLPEFADKLMMELGKNNKPFQERIVKPCLPNQEAKSSNIVKTTEVVPGGVSKLNNTSIINMSEIMAEAMKRKEKRSICEFMSDSNKYCPHVEEDDPSSRISVHEAIMKFENKNKSEDKLSVSKVKDGSNLKYHVNTLFQPKLSYKSGDKYHDNVFPEINIPIKPARSSGFSCEQLNSKLKFNFKRNQRPSSDIGIDRFPPLPLQRNSICGKGLQKLVDSNQIDISKQSVENIKELFCCNCRNRVDNKQIVAMFGSQNNVQCTEEGLGSARSSDISNMLRFEKKSTEDLYIDDDFCQGLNLGANMELLKTNDDDDLYSFLDHDILEFKSDEEIINEINKN